MNTMSTIFSRLGISNATEFSEENEDRAEIEPVQGEDLNDRPGLNTSADEHATEQSVPSANPILPSETVIEARNLHKTYLIGNHAVAALRGVSFKVSHGEFVMIYGKSGSGKSTLLSVLGSVDLPTKGDVQVLGTRVCHRTKDADLAALRLNEIGFVFQAFNLLPLLTAAENVAFPMVLAGRLSRAQRRRRAQYLLERVRIDHRAHSVPAQLSGGEQQRVTIARALANEPGILLLDEPTGDLDPENTDWVMEMLIDLHENDGTTVVMVTHDMTVRGYADRVLYMHDGQLSHEESVPDELRANLRGTLRARNAKLRME